MKISLRKKALPFSNAFPKRKQCSKTSDLSKRKWSYTSLIEKTWGLGLKKMEKEDINGNENKEIKPQFKNNVFPIIPYYTMTSDHLEHKQVKSLEDLILEAKMELKNKNTYVKQADYVDVDIVLFDNCNI